MYPPTRKSFFSKDNSIFRTVQLFSAATFAAFLLVTLNQSVSVDRRRQTDAELVLLKSLVPVPRIAKASPVVEISNGKVQGTVLTARNGREYSAFFQIPYAEPPLGKLRFQAPRPFAKKWSGIKDATVRGGEDSGCVQYAGYSLLGSEDCLKLNVYTPQLPFQNNPRPNLPVMVYILGGAFKFGQAAKYGADYMMEEDLVLVNFDFRVGPFAHLNTEDMEIRGNQALKDQVMALRWVQENIAKFGGDPKRVLIFGNSSGGSYVSAQVISKMSQGLFHAAISQSGSVFLDGGFSTPPLESARQLGTLLNCTDTEDTKALHQCLIDADANDLATKFEELHDFHMFTKEFIPENGDIRDVFFEDYPINLLANGSFQKVPWLVGNNNAEGYPNAHEILVNQWSVYAMNNNWDELAPAILNFEDDGNHTHAKAIRQFYFGTKTVSNKTRYDLVKLMTDVPWINDVRMAADLFAKHGGSVYYYFLTHEPKSGFGDINKIGFSPPYGVGHADDVQFFYPWTNELNVTFPYIDKYSKDYKTSKNLIKIWTNFAQDGIPSAPGVRGWRAIDGKNPRSTKWMEINDKCKLIDPLTERMKFLETIPFRLPLH